MPAHLLLLVQGHHRQQGQGLAKVELVEGDPAVLDEAVLAVPAASKFISTGSRGVHSEHMGYILAEMQYLQRAYPGGAW